MKITFLGDIMIEPPVLKAAKRKGGKYDFSGVFAPAKALLQESDYVVGNLETPIAGKDAGYSKTHLCFNSPDEYVDALIDAGIDLVSTANNHTFDRGFEGAERTIRLLDEKGLAHTGSFVKGEERPEAYYFERDGVKYAIIAYTYGTNLGESGGNCLAEGEYAGTVNLLCDQRLSSYLPGVYRGENKIERFFKRFPIIKNDTTIGKIEKLFRATTTYSRADDNTKDKIDTPFIAQMKDDIRKAKQKADVVLFYPHVGGQFNDKPGAFSEYVVEMAYEAGADAIIVTHSHIPQKAVIKNGVPISYCLGNFNMNPKSYLAMPEILTDYGYAIHIYVENKKIVKTTFSMMKNHIARDGQISSYPIDELYAKANSEKEKQKIEKTARYLYGRVTGKHLEGEIIRREYEL